MTAQPCQRDGCTSVTQSKPGNDGLVLCRGCRTEQNKLDRMPTGIDRIPKASQGWYRDKLTGAKLRRVTTILENGVPKPALPFWSGNVCTDSAIEHLPELVYASRYPEKLREMRDFIRRAHTRKKDERADIGSAVHTIIESIVLGQPIPDDLLNDPEMAVYLDNFLRFCKECEVEFRASEMVVGNYEAGYAGTLDYILRSPLLVRLIRFQLPKLFAGETPPEIDDYADLLGDTKTGGELDEVVQSGGPKGVYPEAGLQMSGYRHAKVCWLKPSGDRVDMPPTAPVGIVLHLRPEGYRVYPIRCDEAVYERFLYAMEVDRWTAGLAKTVLGPALSIPDRTTVRGAA